VARYLWNIALSCAMQPAIHTLEVTLRNNLFAASAGVVSGSGLQYADFSCWLDASPTILLKYEAKAVRKAKATIKAKRDPTPGRLDSKGSHLWQLAQT